MAMQSLQLRTQQVIDLIRREQTPSTSTFKALNRISPRRFVQHMFARLNWRALDDPR